ncbi:MAG: HlyD family efflux transporter periplasmic adaptor subunit [Pseudomonadota bacterium]
MSDLSFQVRAPLGLDLATGERVTISNWSLQGFEFPGTRDVLPKEAMLSIPFQGVEIQFKISLRRDGDSRFLYFDGLTGRQRETLAVFYRSILSGKMASTEEIITSLDTPVDLVPMEETEEERAAATRRKTPRLLRIMWNVCVYAVLAVLIFGFMGQQVGSMLDRIDVDRGRVVAPLIAHQTSMDGFVREIAVAPGDRVDRGDVLMVIGSPDIDDRVALARQELETAEFQLRRAKNALEEIRRATGADGSDAWSITARLALAARLKDEFVHTADAEQMRDLWLSLRELEPENAERFRLDTVIEERLEKLVIELRAQVVALSEKLALQDARRASAYVVALHEGTVREIALYEGQHVEQGAMALHIETDDPRTLLGWVTPDVADRVHLGQRVAVVLTQGETVTSLEGRIDSVRAGPDPGQPGSFGQLVTVAMVGERTDQLQDLLPIDAPVDLTIHRDRFKAGFEKARGALQSLTSGGS